MAAGAAGDGAVAVAVAVAGSSSCALAQSNFIRSLTFNASAILCSDAFSPPFTHLLASSADCRASGVRISEFPFPHLRDVKRLHSTACECVCCCLKSFQQF